MAIFKLNIKEDASKVYISGVPIQTLQKDMLQVWGTTKLLNLYEKALWFENNRLIKFNKFFVPEFLYILSKLPNRGVYQVIEQRIYENTWIKSVNTPIKNKLNYNALDDLTRTLKDYQEEFLHVYDEKTQKYNLNGYLNAFSQGLGKDQPLDCKIKTPTGWKRMGDINVGDIISTPDGDTSRVIGVYPQGIQDVYKITFKDGRSTECGENHLWKFYHRDINRSRCVKNNLFKVENSKMGDISDIRKYMQNSHEYTYIDLIQPIQGTTKEFIIDPYILGVILGDGCVSTKSINIYSDKFIKDKILNMLPEDLCLRQIRSLSDKIDYYDPIRIVGTEYKENSFIKYLRHAQLLGAHSYEKFIPNAYMDCSFEQKLALLQGLMDTDGYVTLEGNIEYSTTSKTLAYQIQYLIRSIGGMCKIKEKLPTYTYKNEKRQGRLAYILNIHYKCPSDLFTLPRKKERLSKKNQYNENLKLQISKIEYIGKKETQCIAIDHITHLYITDDFIVTHNTITSIALMHCLNKNKICIIAPNNTIYTTWVKEIQDTFKVEQKIWTKENPISNARWYIINYESMEKLLTIPALSSDNIGIIVDEIHNFRSTKTDRTSNALQLAKKTKSTDILTMSGTPIKALGSELIPLLSMIDPMFDNDTALLFKKVFGMNTAHLSDIVKNRLGLVMHRKLKEEVLDLPEKSENEIKVTLSNISKYELSTVKGIIQKYATERTDYYKHNFYKYDKRYSDIMTYFEKRCNFNKQELQKYKEEIEIVRHKKYTSFGERNQLFVSTNTYEKKVIYPQLPADMKKQFKKSKSVIKYVEFVVLGEVIGGILPKLRAEMYSDMIKVCSLGFIIEDSTKKTIIFTTYNKVVEETYSYCTNSLKLKPVAIYQKTSKDMLKLLQAFKTKEEVNPLITTIQMMSTGVTITEASTVVFCPPPFRHTDYQQASDRIYRIGQDVDVNIITIKLEHNTPTLDSRTNDIIEWSKSMFESIVGTKVSDDILEDQISVAVESFNEYSGAYLPD